MRTSMKRRITAMLAAPLAAALLLSGCASNGGDQQGDEPSGEKIVIGVALSDASNPFFQTMAARIKEEAEKQGVEIVERSAPVGNDNDAFNNNVDSLVTMGVDGLITAPISPSNQQALQRAADAGIPIVELDSSIPDWDASIAQIQTDNVQAGRDAVELLAEGLGDEEMNIIILNNVLGYQSVNDRTQGAEEAIEELGGNLVQIVDGGVSQAEAQAATETVLRAHPEINAIMGTVSMYSLGAMQAVRTTGAAEGSVLITGVDGSDAEFEAIKAGTYFGTAAQQPAEMGAQGLQIILDALDGKEPAERSVLIPPLRVTADNVDEFLK